MSARLLESLLVGSLCVAFTATAAGQQRAAPTTSAERAAQPAAPLPASPAPVTKEPPYTSRWYGWQILIPDTVAGSVFVGSAAGGSTKLAIVSGAIFVTTGPVIHFAHGHVGKGLASLGLHGGLPLVLGIALSGGHVTSDCTGTLDDGCGAGPLLFGFGVLIGMAGATAIDASVLAHEDVPTHPTVAIMPTLGAGRAGLALAGAF